MSAYTEESRSSGGTLSLQERPLTTTDHVSVIGPLATYLLGTMDWSIPAHNVLESSCTGRSSENICSSSRADAQEEKGNTKMKAQFTSKIGGKASLGPSYFL